MSQPRMLLTYRAKQDANSRAQITVYGCENEPPSHASRSQITVAASPPGLSNIDAPDRAHYDHFMASEADRVIDLYQRYAENWDRERERGLYEKPWLDRFLALLPPKAAVLDLGCGAAEPIARYFIEWGCKVTGVDSSPALIGMCKRRFPGENWIVADMRALPPLGRFDGILAWDSFFHLRPDDQSPMFPVFAAHASPKAALMFTSGDRHGEAIGTYQGEPLYHGSLTTAEYRALLEKKGFGVVSHVVEDPTCGLRTIWLAQQR
jgi:SAM-dependent methyltransferase